MKISKTILSPVMEGLLFAQRLRNRKVIVVLSSFQRKTQKSCHYHVICFWRRRTYPYAGFNELLEITLTNGHRDFVAWSQWLFGASLR